MKYRLMLAFLLTLLLSACGREQERLGNRFPLPSESRNEKMTSKENFDTSTENSDISGTDDSKKQPPRLSAEGGKVLNELRDGEQADSCICSVAFLGVALEPGADIAGFLASISGCIPIYYGNTT